MIGRVRQRKSGFTLVELLVAMALTLFIMVILSQAFIAGAQTFADLKAIGDMNNRLRVASSTLRADLAAMWLTDGSTTPQTQCLSGNRPDAQNPLPATLPTPAGHRGFFRVWQDGPYSYAAPPPVPPSPPSSGTTTTLSKPGPYAIGATSIQVDVASDPASPSQWTIRTGTFLLLDAGVVIGGPPQTFEEVVQVTAVTPIVNTAGATLTVTPALTYQHAGGAPVVVCEGIDIDGLTSVNSVNHTLHFTVFLGNQVVGQAAPDRLQNYASALIGDTTAINPGSLWQFGPAAFRTAGPAGAGAPPNPPPPYNSQWGEVVYFLRENGTSTLGDANPPTGPAQPPMRLYSLYRRQLAVVTDGIPAGANPATPPYSALDPTAAGAATKPVVISPTSQYAWYYEMSVRSDPTATPYGTGNLFFNGPNDLTIPERRFCMSPGTANGAPPPPLVANAGLPLTWGPGAAPVNETYTTQGTYRKLSETIPPSGGTATESTALQGGDLLLSDIISMDVQLFVPAIKLTDFSYLPTIPNAPGNNNTSAGYQGKRVFDTWSNESQSAGPPVGTPNPYNYSTSAASGNNVSTPFPQPPLGIQVILRVWDQTTQKTRQVTIIQDL
jgi:prepilin-type N-terminal cleavage/methylation domain-containing protein